MSNEIKSRPILFSAPMVRAILDGTKSQTRRIAKLPLGFQEEFEQESERRRAHGIKKTCFVCPKGEVGDFLWVRENFIADPPRNGDWDDVCGEFKLQDIPDCYRSPKHVLYQADWKWNDVENWRFRPSIHMPRWASRITLEITDIRVERLNDISEADSIAEGIQPLGRQLYRTGFNVNAGTAKSTFVKLWESINGAGSWAKNPYVFAISFKRVLP